MSKLQFNINWDYRCPFARIINDHIVIGLENGANWDVEFLPFSLTEVHTDESETPSWEDPSKSAELIAVQVGIVVQKKFPDQFYNLHRKLFSARHDEGADLRDATVLRSAISSVGLNPEEIFGEIESGWPLEEFRTSHIESVLKYETFGVPTFFIDGKAAFVRLLERADDNPSRSIELIERIVNQINNHSEINEIKHTTIPF